MPNMDSSMFGLPVNINEQDVANCEIENVGDSVTTILANHGWKGEPVGVIILHLSPDNEKVAAGQFSTRGRDDREFKLRADKIWLDADMNVTATIRMPELDSFSFPGGGLTSDWLQDDEVIHFFHVSQEDGAPRPIITPSLDEWGIGRFCLRLVCYPAKSCSKEKGVMVKFFVMLYPDSKASLVAMSPHTADASWPGLKLGEGEMALLPRPLESWGCPVLALLRPAISFDRLPKAPSSAALRHAIACIMRRCGAPDVSRGATSLAAKWERIRSTPTAFASKEVPLMWPEQERPQAATGKEIFRLPYKSRTIR